MYATLNAILHCCANCSRVPSSTSLNLVSSIIQNSNGIWRIFLTEFLAQRVWTPWNSLLAVVSLYWFALIFLNKEWIFLTLISKCRFFFLQTDTSWPVSCTSTSSGWATINKEWMRVYSLKSEAIRASEITCSVSKPWHSWNNSLHFVGAAPTSKKVPIILYAGFLFYSSICQP